MPGATTDIEPKQTHWEDVAPWYDRHVGDEGSDYHRHVVLPGITRLLNLAPNERLIDIACGQGVFCRQIQKKVAFVLGVDASPLLIDAAKQRKDEDEKTAASMRFEVADARDLARWANETLFDAAVCILAIQNIDPIEPVFANVARLIKPKGRFVMAMMHPCYRQPKQAHWDWDPEKKVQYRRVDRYLKSYKEPIQMHPGSDPGVHTWSFHRPLQAYVRALAKAGLMIDAIEEWTSHKESDSGPRANAENIARQEIPLFLAIRAIRPA